MDERLAITISQLPPHRSIAVRARSHVHEGLYWQSVAVFTSDANGFIDLSAQAPVSGNIGYPSPTSRWRVRGTA